jgi:hypothetical protein
MKTLTAACFVILLLFSLSSAGDSRGSLRGRVASKHLFRGPAGAVTAIVLQVDTLDGLIWQSTCRRAARNLSLCFGVQKSNLVLVEGT